MKEQFKEMVWSHHFGNIRYVRHVLSITDRGDSFGSINRGNYLPKELFGKEYQYRNGDFFIVSTEDSLGELSYSLVQIDINSSEGLAFIRTVRGSSSYPYHSNILLNAILFDENLKKYVTID